MRMLTTGKIVRVDFIGLEVAAAPRSVRMVRSPSGVPRGSPFGEEPTKLLLSPPSSAKRSIELPVCAVAGLAKKAAGAPRRASAKSGCRRSHRGACDGSGDVPMICQSRRLRREPCRLVAFDSLRKASSTCAMESTMGLPTPTINTVFILETIFSMLNGIKNRRSGGRAALVECPYLQCVAHVRR